MTASTKRQAPARQVPVAQGGRLSPRQREELTHAYVTQDGEPHDLFHYAHCGHFAFSTRERVLSALIRRGLLNTDLTLTDAGIAIAERLLDVTPDNGASQ